MARLKHRIQQSYCQTIQGPSSSVLKQTEKRKFVYAISMERVFHLEFQTSKVLAYV